MFKKFLPKETDFFTMFEKAALNVKKSANILVEMMEDLSVGDIKAKEIYEAEQEGDMLTHEVMRSLNKTFLTPVDREDIHALVNRLDDVLDLVWASADRTGGSEGAVEDQAFINGTCNTLSTYLRFTEFHIFSRQN